MRERLVAETPFLPCILPDGQIAMVKTREDLNVVELLKKARIEGRKVRAKDIVDVILEDTSPPLPNARVQSIFIRAYQTHVALNKMLKPAGWNVSRGGLKGREATYELEEIKEEVSLIKAATKTQAPKPVEKKQPNGETSLNGGRFRTPEQKIEDEKRAFADFTIAVLSVPADGKGLSALSRNPDEIVRRLPNGQHIARILPKSKEELVRTLIAGLEATINEMLRKYKHKPRIEFSEKEKHVSILLKEVKRKNPDFQIKNVPPELKKHFSPTSTSSPARQSPKDLIHS